MGLADEAYVADVNTDGVVDLSDLAEFFEAFQHGGDPARPTQNPSRHNPRKKVPHRKNRTVSEPRP